MAEALSRANAALIQEYLRIAAVTDDMDRFGQLLTEDCVWVMMPTGYAFRGFEQVSTLAKTAGGTRTHDAAHRVTILNWFAEGDDFCVEYQHGPLSGDLVSLARSISVSCATCARANSTRSMSMSIRMERSSSW